MTRAGLPFDLDHLCELLLGYQRFAAGWRASEPRLARPGSILESQLRQENELASEWDPHPVQRAVFIGSLQLRTAEEHLVALAHALRDTDVTWPVVTLLRAVLEASARAWRLLDPGLGAKVRTARAMTEELYSAYETAKLPPALRHKIEVSEIEQSAASLGLLWLPGKPPAVGDRRPTNTALTTAFVKAIGGQQGEVRYRWASGVAHGTVHGLMTHVRDDSNGLVPELHHKVVASCVADAAASFGHAFEAQVVLRTGDVGRWHSWHGDCFAIFRKIFDSPI